MTGNPLNPFSGNPAAPGSPLLSGIPGVGPLIAALQVAKGANDLFGPKGAIVNGDPGGIMNGVQSIYGGYKGIVDPTKAPTQIPGPITPAQKDILNGMQLHTNAPDTLADRMKLSNGTGITKDQFDQLSPEQRQALLKQVMGR